MTMSDCRVAWRRNYRVGLKKWSPGLVYFVPAVTYHPCLSLPKIFSQPGDYFVAQPCNEGRKGGACSKSTVQLRASEASEAAATLAASHE